MRTTAVALSAYPTEEVAPLAAGVAALTHPHPDSVDACAVWSIAVHQAIHRHFMPPRRSDENGESYEEPFDDEPDEYCDGPFGFATAVRAAALHLPNEASRRRWDRLVDEVLNTPDLAEARRRFCPNGWVVTALQAALWAILSTPERSPQQHFRDALVTAVRIGDDTDTIAAIAGGLLGARWGLAAIPGEWTLHLHGDRGRGETLTGAELATVALQAFGCTMRRLFMWRAERHSYGWESAEKVTPESIRHIRSLEDWARQCEEAEIFSRWRQRD